MTRRSRPLYLLMLFSLLWSSLGIPPQSAAARPVAPPAPSIQAGPPLRNLPLPPGPPASAGSSGYTAEDAEELIAEKGYDGPPGGRSSATFDGTFTDRGISYQAGTSPDITISSGPSPQTMTLTLPPGTTTLYADFDIASTGPWGNFATFSSRGTQTGIWSRPRELADGDPSLDDVNMELGANAALTETIELRIMGKHDHYRINLNFGKCSLHKLILNFAAMRYKCIKSQMQFQQIVPIGL